MNRSNPFTWIFAKSELSPEPCGVPLCIWCFIQFSRYPARSSFRITSMKASFFLYVGTKRLVKRKEFEVFLSEKLVI